MNTRILFSLLTIGLMSASLGYGTYAFFSDTEQSTGNLFSAGSLDLTLDGLNGVTATITGTNFAPGDVATGSLLLRNEGTIHTGDAQGHTLDLDFRAHVSVLDDVGNPEDPDDGGVSAVPFSRFLVLTQLEYDGQDLLAQVADADGDGRISLADLDAHGAFTDLADPLAAGKSLDIAVLFDTAGGNDLRRDQVEVELTFFLAQAGEVDLE